MNEPLVNLINEAQALVKKHDVPLDLQSDWDGTNHYELQSSGEDYWWLDVEDALSPNSPSDTIPGQRLGYCLESAALLPRLIQALTSDNSYAQGFRDGEEAAMRKYEADPKQLKLSGGV